MLAISQIESKRRYPLKQTVLKSKKKEFGLDSLLLIHQGLVMRSTMINGNFLKAIFNGKLHLKVLFLNKLEVVTICHNLSLLS